jgi:hypothetical protein
VNGDGRPDLVVVDGSANAVSVLLNTTAPGATTPSFAAAVSFPVGTLPFMNPASVAVADVNGDGRPDLLVANDGAANVSVLLNTTAPGAAVPSFSAATNFNVGSGPFSVVAADVNGDGRPDLIVANDGSGTVSVLLNTTAPGAAVPSFAPAVNFAVGSSPLSVAVADVNGDGRPDLVVARNLGNVSVLLNTTAPGATTPSFSAATNIAAGDFAFSVAAVDVNGDGRPDLLLADGGSNVLVLLNTTAPGATVPSFAVAGSFAAGTDPNSVAVADVNGDGHPDLVVANGIFANTVSVLLNVTCILGDINCDGLVDILDYGVWRQNFGQQGAGNPADLNGDGIVDIRDYGVWRQNFGHTPGGAALADAPRAVPTPGTATPLTTRAVAATTAALATPTATATPTRVPPR